MRESPLKDNLRYLAERAVQKVASGDRPLEYFASATKPSPSYPPSKMLVWR